MQAISNSKQNSQGKVARLGNFSPLTSNNVEKTLPKLKKLKSKKPFDLFIKEDKQIGNSVQFFAQTMPDHFNGINKKTTAYSTNRSSNPAGLYLEAAKQVVHDYDKQYVKTGNPIIDILNKLAEYLK